MQESPNNVSSKCSKKIKEKRSAVAAHRELMKELLHELQHANTQSCACSRHTLVAHVMTSDYTNVDDLKTHTKQHLNAFHSIYKLMKKVTNDDNETPRWLSQHNHSNLTEQHMTSSD